MFKICKHQLQMAFSSPRIYISLFWGSVMQIVSAMPLLDFSEKLQKPLCIWEGFVYFCCDTYIIAAAFLGIIILVSDIPFSSENETYTLLRTSRKKWVAGKSLYLLCVCCIYYFCILLVGLVFINKSSYIGNFWSEPLFYLTKQPDLGDNSIFFPYKHVLSLSPFKAVASGLLLNICYGFLMSLFLLLFNLKLPRSLGYFATMMIHVIGYILTVLFLSMKAVKFSLFGNSLLMYHEIGSFYEDQFLKLHESVFLFAVTTVIVVLLILKVVKKYDFKITVGTRQ